MKTSRFQNWFAVTGVVIFLAGNASAQDSNSIVVTNPTAPGENPPAVSAPAASAPAPTLASSVSQVLQLSQAKVSDGTIVNFIQNSSAGYPLAASQIIYLKQQGVSDNVINAMLNQRGSAPAPTETASASVTESTPNATVAPTVTYVQSVPSSTVYVIPDSQTYRYNGWYYGYGYPYGYSYYPPVSVSFGFGWGWHDHDWHGGWHGGYGGGWHGGGGFRGGGWHH